MIPHILERFSFNISELENSAGQKQKSGSKHLLKALRCAFNQLRNKMTFFSIMQPAYYHVVETRALLRLGCFQIWNSTMLPEQCRHLSGTFSHIRTLIAAMTSYQTLSIRYHFNLAFSLSCCHFSTRTIQSASNYLKIPPWHPVPFSECIHKQGTIISEHNINPRKVP